MADRKQLEFFVLRYVPNAVKQEFVNFGLLVMEHGPDGAVISDVRFAKDWNWVLRHDPDADLDALNALAAEIRQEIGQARDRAVLIKRMEDSFSGAVQLSAPMPTLAEIPALEIEEMVRMHLESSTVPQKREPTGRQAILNIVREAFESAGVGEMVHPVPAEPYTKPGDPFKFDFGYRVADGSAIRLFHAVSLKASVDGAVVLAARYPKIATVMEKVVAPPTLTAVIDEDLDRGRSEVGFALEMMEESRIRVAFVTEMAGIAETARRELGV